jgi:S-adenosylmethionine decarboxylase
LTTLGIHLLAELWDCNSELLDSLTFVDKMMVDAAEKSGATVINKSFHQFCPQGVSGVVIIAESHLTIHTWPENQYAAVDIFTCGTKVDPWTAVTYIEELLESGQAQITDFYRGLRENS